MISKFDKKIKRLQPELCLMAILEIFAIFQIFSVKSRPNLEKLGKILREKGVNCRGFWNQPITLTSGCQRLLRLTKEKKAEDNGQSQQS